MNEKKRYIKFYSKSDLSSGYYLRKTQTILDDFDEDAYINSNDINSIIELFNIQQFFDNEMFLNDWTTENIETYKNIVSSFGCIIGKCLSNIDETNIEDILSNIYFEYKDDFWYLFDKYKLYNHISNTCFERVINNRNEIIESILKCKGIVIKYDNEISSFLKKWDLTGRIVVENYLSSHINNYYFPNSFNNKYFDDALIRYIDLTNCSMNYLELIYKSASSQLKINNTTKLKAKEKYNRMRDDFFKDKSVAIGKFSISIEYGDGFSQTINGGKCTCVYDKKWFDEHLDFPTILNNFKYVYNYWDECWRISLVSKDIETGVVERIASNKGNKWYFENYSFKFRKMKSSAEMICYYKYLKEKDIDLCGVLEWFFKDYLFQEFEADGFEFNAPSSGTSFLEKNKILLSELDGVLKQFRLFVENGSINRDLFELCTEQMQIDSIPSFIKNKYAYPNDNDIKNAASILFHHSYLVDFAFDANDYEHLCALLFNENINTADLNDNQLKYLSCLERMDAITVTDGNVKLNIDAIALLNDIYCNEVLCLSYSKKYSSIIDEWVKKGYLRVESTLFSIPEQKYLKFMLNKNEFTNGPELRNKYIHSNYSKDTKVQEEDFYEILKIVILVIGKINEEFILRERQYCYVK